MNFISVPVFLLIIGYLFSPVAKSQNSEKPELLLGVSGHNKLLKYSLESNSSSLIYEGKFDEIKEVKVSPDEEYAGLIETSCQKNVPTNYLTVIDETGKVVAQIKEDVRFFEWNPKGEELAFISGTYYEGGIGFKPTGVYILNIDDNHLEKVEAKGFFPYRLNLVQNEVENAIYFDVLPSNQDIKIVRYNLARKKFEKTTVGSIDLSPDGQYYYQVDNECYCAKFFETKTNSLVNQYEISKFGGPVGWAYMEGHLFIFSKDEYQKIEKTIIIDGKAKTGTINGELQSSRNIIYDVASNMKVQEFGGILQSERRLQRLSSSKKYLVSISASDYSKGLGKSQRSLKTEGISVWTHP